MGDLNAIFLPKAMAVVGASKTPGKVGHDIFENILRGGFTGTLYPVNPSARSVLSVKAYPSILDIPDELDLSMLILPPQYALKAVEESAEKGVKGIVIVSAGFREVGPEGQDIENRIVAICKEAGIRLVGPNCLGVINPLPEVRLNASFSTRMPKAGNISFISQSGALCTAVLDFAADRDFGFSKFISIGNKADVDELDLLNYLHRDMDTEVIMIYLEELRRKAAEFIDQVKDITSGDRPTPILAIKSGRTTAGARAAASHTGSLAGSEGVYDAIFQQAGIIRINTINELFDYAGVFAYKNESALGKYRRKVPDGNRVAIVTNAGGPGIVATDMTVTSGLRLSEFRPDTVEALASHLPRTANLTNPVDIIGDAAPERYENALWAVIRDEGVDGALVILTPQSMTNALETAKAIARIARRSHKPILCSFMGIVDVSAGVKYLQEQGIPVFRFPEEAAKAFGVLYKYANWLNRQHLAHFSFTHDTRRAADIIKGCLDRNKLRLGEVEGTQILECYGFTVLPTRLAADEDEACRLAEEIGFPVAMKISSEQIIHKSDAGGVKLNVTSNEGVKAVFGEIIDAAKAYHAEAVIDGVIVQKMAPSGDEIIVGINDYPVFGSLLMFGLGGIFVEVLQDVTFRFAPIQRNEARRMIRSIRSIKLLEGFRNKPRADMEELVRTMVRLSDLAENHPEIKEMDVNPLLVHSEGSGATVADCRIILASGEEENRR
ncbi:MAG: acetate--CoA ligase family protein [Desulfobacterales bacterium]